MRPEELEALKTHTTRHITALYEWTQLDPPAGKLRGSGTFISMGGETFTLTAGHVITGRPAHYGFGRRHDDEDARAVLGPFYTLPDPLDLGLVYLGADAGLPEGQSTLSCRAVAQHSPDPDAEGLFLHGYPGAQSRTIWPRMMTRSMSLPLETYVDECNDGQYDEENHYAVSYPQVARDEAGNEFHLPDPRGLSGSAVWRSPIGSPNADPEVVGVVHTWIPVDDCLIVTRVEKVRQFMLDIARRRRAYFGWIDAGRPELSALDHWLAAEERYATFNAL